MVLTRSELSDLLTDNLAMFEAHLESGVITWASRAMEAMFGYTIAGELEGKAVEDLIPVELRQKHADTHRPEFVVNPSVRLMGKSLALRGLRRDGSEFPLETMLLPKAVSGRRVVVGIMLDLTGRLPRRTQP